MRPIVFMSLPMVSQLHLGKAAFQPSLRTRFNSTCIAACFVLSLLSCFGTSYTWNVASGDWSVPGNWMPNGVPGSPDTATINNGIVTVSTEVTVGTLNLAGGTLDGIGTLTVSSNLNWTAG